MEMVQGTHTLRRHGSPYKKPRQRNRIIALIMAALIALPFGTFAHLQQTEYVVSASVSVPETPAPQDVQLPWPSQGLSAIGATGQGVLAASGPTEQPVPIASITKLFTAVAVLDKKPIPTGETGETLTITPQDEMLYYSYLTRGGTVVPVSAGQELSEYHALQALLLPSANNIADTLVTWAFGSVDAYVEYANSYFKSKGLHETTIADASGFSPATVSSTSDLVKLGELVLKNDTIAEVISKSAATVPGIGTIYNTNQVLGQQHIIGGKTGYTEQAGDCLLFFANHPSKPDSDSRIIGVLVGQPRPRSLTFETTRTLLAAAQRGFHERTVLEAGETVGYYRTPWGTEVAAVTDEKISVFSWHGTKLTPEIQLQKITAGVTPERPVGSVVVANGTSVYESSVRLQEPLTKPPLAWQLTNILEY